MKKDLEMKKFYVYVHVCPNGKRYVGITTRIKPERRWGKNGESYQYNKHFYSAILKYGWDNISHEVFEVESEEEMYRKEVELISFYHSNDPEYGYNNSVGGEKGALGCKHSEEARKNQSEALKKRNSDPEVRRKISEAIKKGLSDPEVRRKMSESHKGKSLSEEVRKHMSEAAKKSHSDPEYRKKISEAGKGKHSKPLSEEHKRRISEAAKERNSDPEYRRKLSEAQKGKPRSEETRKHMSEIRKGKPLPRVKIKLPDGTILEVTKPNLGKNYIRKGKKFEYVS